MKKKLDAIVFIGRFQPLHNAHIKIIQKCFALADSVIILVGSKNSPRTIKNPWTYEERKDIIIQSVFNSVSEHGLDTTTFHIHGISDHVYNDNAWISEVDSVVDFVVKNVCKKPNPKIGIAGHDKDHSTFYLNYFPQWEYINMPGYPNDNETIDATKIRNLLFSGNYTFVKGVVPDPVFDAIIEDMNDGKLESLLDEWKYIQDYKKAWSVAPYEPTFVTADAVVVQSGHILLVERAHAPGKGLWAMPGGFINPKEKIIDAAIRELREETRLKVPEKVLRGSIDAYGTYDDPDRSLRGRTITHAYRFTLDSSQPLPEIRGSSDAKRAKWFTLGEYRDMENVMFEDHYHIIENMLLK